MRRFLPACLLFLAACASTTAGPDGALSVALLAQKPDRPYEEIARLEVRGELGAVPQQLYDELRERAYALGADAVVPVEEHALSDATPAPYDPPQRPLLGNAYPGVFSAFERGAFPPEGFDVRTRGRYYVVEALAIRYLD